MDQFDYLIVGAGFAGSVCAERLASAGKTVLLIDQRSHLGGNAYDRYNADGILVQQYGPHIFHTNSREVFSYLSRFTAWRPYEHRVRAMVNGQLVPFPINLDTINALHGTGFSRPSDVEVFLEARREHPERIETSEDAVVSQVGRDLYETFYRGYTWKQWGLEPSELDASVAGRVPVRTHRDDRYFTDIYQAMPREGYSRLFELMTTHAQLRIRLNTSYRDVATAIPHRAVIYTGPIDEFFDYRLGRLPYRSQHFEFRTVNKERFQPVAVVNYPSVEYPYTRVTEFKHLTGQDHPQTTLAYEYPSHAGEPYHPIPRPENRALYEQYRELAAAIAPRVHFIGRLGTYKYLNMDQVVAQALTLCRQLLAQPQEETCPQR